MMRPGSIFLLVLLAGCGGVERPDDLEDQLVALRSPDPAERAWAVAELSRRRAREAVPGLVACLRDEDGGIRLYASAGLKEITGQDHGYLAFAPVEEREAAVRRWETWLEEQWAP